MNRTFLSSRSGAVPRGLLGMIVLVVVVEGFVARQPMDFLDVDDWCYRTSVKAVSRDARRADVLCFGDSLIKFAVIPQAVRERSGLHTYNLAVSGSQAPASHVVLKRALDAGVRPSAVVVDFSPRLLELGPRHNLMRWANLLTTSEAAALASWARDPDLFTTIALGKMLPSFHRRQGIRANLKGRVIGTGDWRRYTNFLYLRHWGRNAGAQLGPASTTLKDMTADEAEAIRRGFYGKVAPHPANAEGMRRFLDLAAERGVTVYWVLPPVWPAVQRSSARSGFDAQFEAFARSWQERFPNLVVVDGRATLTDPAAFFDANHVSAHGAYAFSLELGDVLRGASAGTPPSRWVALPACRPVPIPAGVEDMDQSRMALDALAPARR